jgi:HPt (histidine-containing phosphotransfer) domain-containing protein
METATRIGLTTSGSATRVHAIEGIPPEPLFDQAVLLERLDGDLELLREVVQIFAADAPRLLGELHDALDQGNADRVGRAAHTLKGSLALFGAHAATEAARELEMLGRTGNLANGKETAANLVCQLDALLSALADLSATADPPSPCR